jgi:hypothetical protein
MAEPTSLERDFSLVLGGPLYQLFRRAHLAGPALEMLVRRILILTGVAWLPLLLLSVKDGNALGEVHGLSFLRDIEAQVRFLLAVPVLIAAELIVHLRTRATVTRFVDQGLIRPASRPKFDAAIRSALRLRNSVVLEVALLIFVLTVGSWIWQNQIALGQEGWYGAPVDGRLRLTAAGVWYARVSVPIFQFLFLRWYLRLLIWFRFLWQVSRLHLHLIPTHPDHSGGLAFLGRSTYAFGPLLLAQGAMLAGLIATRILFGGQTLLSFKMDAVGLIALMVLVLVLPLTFFTPQLARARREGLAEYGILATRYVADFERKWIRGESGSEELLGSADIQSLADLGNSYAQVQQMRVVPVGLQDVLRLAATSAVPLLPLGLTVFPLDELVLRLLKVVF